MKWLYLIISMLVKRFTHTGRPESNPMEKIKEFIKENAIKILLAFSAASALGTLLVSGVVITIVNLTAQHDAGLQLKFTAVTVAGLGITLVCLSIFAVGIYYTTAEKREEKREEKAAYSRHPLENALMLLVNDFIQEREFKREFKREHPRAQPTSHHHPHPQPHEEMNVEDFRSSEEFERH
ncbi:MAG: hypothetical protein PHY93_01530 [Bacteriovorax sp.]|nr:hypothetical protein [Bacteriovorax sp.]